MRADLVKIKNKMYVPDVEGFAIECDNLREWESYYNGDPSELRKIWNHREASRISPNNFSPSGYPRYIVDIMAGYMGSPESINYVGEGKYKELIDAINKKNHENTLTSKQIKQAGIFGKSCELHFIEKDGDKVIPRFVDVSPMQVEPVYSTSIAKELLSVIWQQETMMRVYYADRTDVYTKVEGVWEFDKEVPNDYGMVPWVITQNNSTSTPTWLCVKNYVDIIDALQTNTLNALDRHARGTLITSLEKTDELVKNLSALNAVFGMEKGDQGNGKDFFDFVEQNLDPDLREAMLNHFINELHKISGIFDFTKLDLGQDPSGTALKYRIYPMELKASEIVAYRQEGLERRYELIDTLIESMTVMGVNTKVEPLTIKIERNIPDNVKAILEENNLMAGYVDSQTLIERIPNMDAEEIAERKSAEAPQIEL
jgi:SPP1 family phage portal protein